MDILMLIVKLGASAANRFLKMSCDKKIAGPSDPLVHWQYYGTG